MAPYLRGRGPGWAHLKSAVLAPRKRGREITEIATLGISGYPPLLHPPTLFNSRPNKLGKQMWKIGSTRSLPPAGDGETWGGGTVFPLPLFRNRCRWKKKK